MGNFGIILGLAGRAVNDGKRERLGASASLFPLPGIPRARPFVISLQAYGQETFTVKATRKRFCGRERLGFVFLRWIDCEDILVSRACA